MYGMEKFKLNVPLLYRFNILDRHYHIAQDLVYQHIRRGSRFPDEIREIDHVSFPPDNTCFPRWRFDFHAKYLLCSNILSLHNYRFSEFFRKIKENEDKRNFRETEGSLFIRHRIYRYRYNSVNKILSHPNPLFFSFSLLSSKEDGDFVLGSRWINDLHLFSRIWDRLSLIFERMKKRKGQWSFDIFHLFFSSERVWSFKSHNSYLQTKFI